MNREFKIFLISAGVITTQSIIHYNLGRKFERNEVRILSWPKEEELMKLIMIIFGASIASTMLITMFVKR